MCDAIIKVMRREEMSKFAELSECTNTDEICLVPNLSLSAVDKEMYTHLHINYDLICGCE